MSTLRQCALLFAVLILSSLHHHASAQSFAKRYINSIINDTSDISKPQFLIYPTLAYAPETSWEIGLSSLYVYYQNRDTTNRLSEISGFSFFTLENQYGFWFEHALYSDQDKWFFLGDIKIQSFPIYYHGIGYDTPSDYLALVDANQILIKERVLRKIKKDFFIGLELDYQRMRQVNFENSASAPSDFPLPLGAQGSTNFGVGLGIVYDNRHNVLNVRDGFFAELGFLRYSDALGSTFNFSNVFFDTRYFKPVSKRNVFAAQMIGQFNSSGTPFNQLALLGGESMMRGYYLGRYRDFNQIAAQAEFRMLPLPLGFTNRIGAAVFASTGNVFPSFDQASFNKMLYSGGAGLRFLLFPKKDIWTRLDYALTSEGSGFYLFIGESF